MEIKYLISLLSVVLVLGCVNNTGYVTSQAAGPVVESGDHVFVDYTGTLEDGTVFDSSQGRAPLEFTAGAGQMIKGFDDAVIGMKEGEEKTVTIQPEDAYGFSNPANVFDVPVENIPNGTQAGNTLFTGNGQRVRVVEINNETAVIDANHFLAGKVLIFRIKIVKIEKQGK